MRRIFVDGASGRRPVVPHGPERLAASAKLRLSGDAFAYLAGGAGAEATMAANRAGFDRRRIVPRMLEDVSEASLATSALGFDWPAPLFLAPMGVSGLWHRDGDLAIAEGAAAAGLPMTISSQASKPMEEIARALGDTPFLFQLYWSREEALTRSLVKRAEGCGARAIVLTLDTKMLGWRPRDLDRAHLPFLAAQGIAQYTSDPVFNRLLDAMADDPDAPKPRLGWKTPKTLATMLRTHPGHWRENLKSQAPMRAARLFTQIYSNPALGRDHVKRLRDMTDLPIVLKGIQHPDDAAFAAQHDCGVYVSNHGGRQVDGAVGSIDILPAIVERVAGRVPILFDSGVRSGADAFKALALGADAVGIGRPWGYGLAIAGVAGVDEVMRGIASELELTMRLSGATNLDETSAALLE